MPVVPRNPQRPTFPRLIREQEREARQQTQRPPAPDNPGVSSREIVYSYQGKPMVNDVSGGYLIRDPEAILTGCYITARSAGSTASTLQIGINGASAYAVTMAAGEAMTAEDALNLEVSEWDVVTVWFTASGTGLSSVVVHIGYDVIDP